MYFNVYFYTIKMNNPITSRSKFQAAAAAVSSVSFNSIIACAMFGGLSLNSNAVPNEKPNIIFIITDQQFADVMSCRMGNKYFNTPGMDRLAANEMLFTRAYSPNQLSMPAQSSLFTGMYTHTTGIQSNNAGSGGGGFGGSMPGGQRSAVQGELPARNGVNMSYLKTTCSKLLWSVNSNQQLKAEC